MSYTIIIIVAANLHLSRGGFLISNTEVSTINYGVGSGEMVLVNGPTTSAEDSPPPAHRASYDAVYRFVHDRVQQAAAFLLNPEDTIKTHVRLSEVSFIFTLSLSLFLRKHQ